MTQRFLIVMCVLVLIVAIKLVETAFPRFEWLMDFVVGPACMAWITYRYIATGRIW